MDSRGKSVGAKKASPEVDPFARTLDDCLSTRLSAAERRSRVLRLPQRFHDIVSRRLAELRPTRKATGQQDDVDMLTDEAESSALTANQKEIKLLEAEAQTWDLVRRVIPLRYSGGSDAKPAPNPFGTPEPTIKTLIDEFLENNPVAQERLAVVQWLQNNAAAGPDIDELVQELQQNADRGDIIAHGWLHTRTSIKLRKGVTAWPHLLDRQSPKISSSHTNSNGAPLVTQLDPDAVTRQGRKLEPQDEYFERAIWLGCFEHLRRGSSLEVIRDWCQERTEMWRAISMSAMLLSRDDKKTHWDSEPSSLALWRRMCFGVARQGGSDDYERAVYGVLSGDISSVEKVAKTWDDHLFAHYNALLRTQLDTFVLSRCSPAMTSTLTQAFSSFDAVQYHGEEDGLDRRLIQSLASQKGLGLQAKKPEKVLQAAVIAKDLDHYLYAQGLALLSKNPDQELARECGYDMMDAGESTVMFFAENQRGGLRIAAHVYVLIALLERLDIEQGKKQPALLGDSKWSGGSRWEEDKRRSVQSTIIASYTEYLRETNLPELIPLYCSILDPPRSYEVLSRNAIHVTDTGARIIQLKLIKQAGIDVVTFVKTQASLLFEAAVAHQGKSAAGATFKLIEDSAPSARYGPKVKADFFGEDENAVDEKHRELVRSVEWLLMVNETWPEVFAMGSKIYKFFLKNMHMNAARLLMKSVSFHGVVQDMGALDDYEDDQWYDDADFWAQHLERCDIQDVTPQVVMKNARTFRELEALVKALDSLENVASMVELSGEMPVTNREFWDGLGEFTTATKENMQPLLRQWLLSEIQEGDEELAALRTMFLPETMLGYLGALHFAGTSLSRDYLLECMELATIVAERGSDLAASFVEAGRMRELVDAFAAASRALAIRPGEKKSNGSGSKKLRETGWSRDLWSVKS